MREENYNLVDYHTHPYSHGEVNVDLEYLKTFVSQAKKRELKELGFSDHDIFLDNVDWNQLISFKKSSILPLKLGIEIGYREGKEDEFKKILNKYPLDYVIGSVHYIGDWNFDHPDFINEFEKRDIHEIYSDYFSILGKAVTSGLFDIVGHLDLIKIYNYYPQPKHKKTILDYAEPVLEKIKQKDLVVEINTNGLNKPVREIYPAKKIIKKMYSMNIPVTLGSDAHTPDRVGEKLSEVAELISEIGYQKIACFKERKKHFVKL
ncbi:MAG: histidinol-phosphatase HisJ family protein [Bacillota bacterium]